jgi:hypothetical protein
MISVLVAIAPLFESSSDRINFLGDMPSVKLSRHTLRQRWFWLFSRFLGGSKQLKPPYKQGGEAQNAKIILTLSGWGFYCLRPEGQSKFNNSGGMSS